MMSVRSMLSVVMSFVVVVCIDAVKNELESSKMIECIEKTTKINLRHTGIELDDEESKILNTDCKGIDKGKIYNALFLNLVKIAKTPSENTNFGILEENIKRAALKEDRCKEKIWEKLWPVGLTFLGIAGYSLWKNKK